jgi:hypothetical protein
MIGPVVLLDGIRASTLRLLAPHAPWLLRDREARVALHGLFAISLALALTFAAPMVLLAVGPIVLGVPHLAADVRYLVASPGLSKRTGFWLLVAGPAGLSFLLPHAWVALTAVVGGAAVARTSWNRRLVVALPGIALVAASFRLGRTADIVIAHAHNAVAVALFWAWTRRRSRLHLLVVVTFVLGAVAIAAGAFDGSPVSRLMASDLHDATFVTTTLAPLADPVLAARLVLVFAFAQSVHYAVWVRLLPEEARPRPGMRSFASSLRALRADLGTPLVVLTGLLTMGLAVWACQSLAEARDGYLRLAIFHGPLELGAATILLLEGGIPRTKVPCKT